MFSELCLCYCRRFSNIPYLQSWIPCITHCVSWAASSTSAIPNTIRRLIILFVAQDCGIGISSVRRATPSRIRQRCHRSISIHALRAEGDSKSSQNIAHLCSISTKTHPADITIHVLVNYVKVFSCCCLYFLQIISVRSLWHFSVRCTLAPQRYSSSTSSCAHCGQRPICSTLFL